MASEKTLTTERPNAVIADQGLIYCRMPGGEVVACDASDMELMKKIRRGWQVLSDYGQFGSSAYYMDHPYEPLFQAGGAHELSVAQITQLGYHLHPPLVPTCDRHVGQDKDHLTHAGRPGGSSPKAAGCWRGARAVHFPQLAGVDLGEPPDDCEYCGRDDFPSVAALKQHQDVMHTDRRQQERLGEAIVNGLHQTGVLGSSSSSAQDIAAAVAATLQALGYGLPHRPDPGPGPEPGDELPEKPDEDEPNGEPEPEPEGEPASASRRGRRVPVQTTISA
ncbi:MAG TPA: hypothetical protein VFB50_17500 [Chloroflexota bacterium]|nr:hypothetical protein [Chloroflexota bacterium]